MFMKKNTGVTAFFVANAVVLSLIALSGHKPKLTKLADNFVKTKRKQKQINTKIVPRKAISMEEKPKELISENALLINDEGIKTTDIINIEEYYYQAKQIMNDTNLDAILTREISSLYPKSLPVLCSSNEENQYSIVSLDNSNVYDKFPLNKNARASKAIPYLPFRKLFGTMALIVALNSLNTNILDNKGINIDCKQESVKDDIKNLDDLKDYLIDKMDVVVTLNNHEAIVDRKVERIMNQDIALDEKFRNIFALDALSQDEKINEVLNLENVSYIDKFNFFINSGYFSLDEAIKIITNSKIVAEEEIFNYIIALPDLDIEGKIDYIINAKSTNYKELFDYILNNPDIPNFLGRELVAKTTLVPYREKFTYFMQRDDSLYQKVWNVLQIPEVEFVQVFNDLLSYNNIKQEELIEAIMRTELVNFDTLFKNILNIKNISSKEISNYLVYFNNYFNDNYSKISLKEIVTYALDIKTFTTQDKVECFWGLLDGLTIEDKQQFILDYYNIDYVDDYIPLLVKDEVMLTKKEKMILDLFNNINKLKLDYVLSHYDFNNEEEFKAICAGCAAEGANSYKDMYWVANILFNRITHPSYSKKGTNPYAQFTAPCQFAVYLKDAYLLYLYPNDETHKKKNDIATQAALDMFYLGYNGIEHNYIEFRSWSETDFSDNYAVYGGNRFKVTLKDENRLIYDNLNGSENFSQAQENILSLKNTSR